MAVQNPILNALRNGGGSASNALSAASRTGALANASFQKGASMALKMDQLLQQQESEVYNRMQKAESNLQKGLQNSIDQSFKQQSMDLKQKQFTELQDNNDFNQALATNKFNEGTRRYNNTFDYTATHNALSAIPKEVKTQNAQGITTMTPNPAYYKATDAINKKFGTSYPTTAPEKVTAVYNATEEIIPPTTITPPVTENSTTAPAPVTDVASFGLGETNDPANLAKAMAGINATRKAGGTITPEQVAEIKSKVDPKYHKNIDGAITGLNSQVKGNVKPPATLSKTDKKVAETDVAATQGLSSAVTPAQFFSVPTSTLISKEGVYTSKPTTNNNGITILSDGKKVNLFKNNVYKPDGTLSKGRDATKVGSGTLPNPEYVVTQIADENLLATISQISQDNSLPQSYKDSYYKGIAKYKPYLLVNTQFVSDLYNTVETQRMGSGKTLFNKIKVSLAAKLEEGVLDKDYVIPMQNMIDARVKGSIPNKKMEAIAKSEVDKAIKASANQKEGRTVMGQLVRGGMSGIAEVVTLGMADSDKINKIGIDQSIQDNVETAKIGAMNQIQKDYEQQGYSPTLVRMQAVNKTTKYVDKSFGQLTVDIEPWEELHGALSDKMNDKDVGVAMQAIFGTKREDVWKSKYQRTVEAADTVKQATVYGKFLNDLTTSLAIQNETGSEVSQTTITVEVNGKEIKIPKNVAYKLIGFDELGSAGSNE